MATIKSFTDLSQSKTLSKFLPIESADYCWGIDAETLHYNNSPYPCAWKDYTCKEYYIPCWSLTALLSVLPNNKHITTTLSRGGWKIEPVEYIDKWFCEYEDEVDEDSPCKAFTVSADNPVDVCVAMIEKLHELKML